MAKKFCILSAGAAVSALLSSEASMCFPFADLDQPVVNPKLQITIVICN